MTSEEPTAEAAPQDEAVAETLPLAVLAQWTPTGDVRVDTAIELLSGIHVHPVAEHIEVFGDVHRRLQDALAEATGR